MSDKRNYSTASENVRENYRLARKYQSVEHVYNLFNKYIDDYSNKIEMTIPEALQKLNNFTDLSDPDMSLPNIYHCYQTAEKIREDGLPDYMQLVGLIHDLGKVLYLKGSDDDGTSISCQYSLVGDTFIVGCPLPTVGIPYPEFLTNEIYNDKYGIYYKGIGLDNCIISFGHDEYLYQVLKNTDIPEDGLSMIRYHSLYAWHTYDQYSHLTSFEDIHRKKMVKLFNKYDLYSKENVTMDISLLEPYYLGLIEKYIGLHKLLF